MGALFRLVDEGSLEVVMSRIVQMELLVKPIRERNLDAVGEVIHFTERTPNVRMVDLFHHVVVQAAFVRADSLDIRDEGRDEDKAADGRKCREAGLAVPDCLVVATGIVTQCDATITNDRRWRRTLERLALRPPMARGPQFLNLPPTLYLHEYVDD
jgi:predicted nucleic acid-binding protein